MTQDEKEFASIAFALVGVAVYIVNIVKIFTTALSDQVGLAIIHSVGLIFPLTFVTVWF